jgi:hypothetical protein
MGVVSLPMRVRVVDHLVETYKEKSIEQFFKDLRREIEADQDTLQDLIEKLGKKESAVRKAGAWVAEKLSRAKIRLSMKLSYLILAVVFSLNYSSYAAPRVISVRLSVQSAFGADMIYRLFSSKLLKLRNVVIRNQIPYEQGIHVFAQPVIGRSGQLDAYSLAVTGTTSLAFANGVPNDRDTRELYRSTRLLYVPAYQLPLIVAEIVHQLAREQF